MKIKLLLFITTIVTISVLKAQDYVIVNVEPDTIIGGTTNELIITLDKSIDPEDYLWMTSIAVLDEEQDDTFLKWNWSGEFSFADSVVTANVYVSDWFLDENEVLVYIYFRNGNGTYDSIFYDQPITIDFPLNYKIKSVNKDILLPGEENEIQVTLDQMIEANDSIMVHIYSYEDGVLKDHFFPMPGNLSQKDSTVSASIHIPDEAAGMDGVLRLECINTADWSSKTIEYNKTLQIGGHIYLYIPEICMVNVDSNNKNRVIWESGYEDYIDSILIYKETAVTDEFEIIGRKSIEENTLFVDEESANAPNSNRYKIAVQDTSGVVSKISSPHKTMHLTMNVGINGAINLIWEKYEGFEYSTFHIYRGSSKEEMVKIAEIASNLFTFTDLNPSFFQLYYQVVIEKSSPCNISMEKSTASTYSLCKSNFVAHTVLSNAALQYSEQMVYVYPNPATDNMIIRLENAPREKFDIVIRDIAGRLVQSYSQFENGREIDLSNLKAGTYILIVRSNAINQSKIIIKE